MLCRLKDMINTRTDEGSLEQHHDHQCSLKRLFSFYVSPNNKSSEDGALLRQEKHTCSRCPSFLFKDSSDFWKHIHSHVASPTVAVPRLTEADVKALRKRGKSNNFAPVKSSSLKVTSGANCKAVPVRVLVGPYHDVRLLNSGEITGPMKAENEGGDSVGCEISGGGVGREAGAGKRTYALRGQTMMSPTSNRVVADGNPERQLVLPDADVECGSGHGSGSNSGKNDVGDSVPVLGEDLLQLSGGSGAVTAAGAAVSNARSSVARVEGDCQNVFRDFLVEQGEAGGPASNANLEFSPFDRLGELAFGGERAADQAALDSHCQHVKQKAHGNQQQQKRRKPPPVHQRRTPAPPQQQHPMSPPVQQDLTPPTQQQEQQIRIAAKQQRAVKEQPAPVQQPVQQVHCILVPQGSMQTQKLAPCPATAQTQQRSINKVMQQKQLQQQQQVQLHPRPPPLDPAPAPLMQQNTPPTPQATQIISPFQPHPGKVNHLNSHELMWVNVRQHNIPPGMPQQVRQVPTPRMQKRPLQQGMVIQQQQQHVVQGSAGPAKRAAQPCAQQQPKQRRTHLITSTTSYNDVDHHVGPPKVHRVDSGFLTTSIQGSQSSRQVLTTNRNESSTPSVRGQQNQLAPPSPNSWRGERNTVASHLPKSGNMVTPACGGGRSGGQGPAPSQQQLQQHRQVNRHLAAPTPPQPQQKPVTTSKSSTVLIIPSQGPWQTSKQPQQPQQVNFSVSQGCSRARPLTLTEVDRPPRPPTVDLTCATPPPPSLQTVMGRRIGGQRSSTRHMCSICDKPYTYREDLNLHMQVHRISGQPPFRCSPCSIQFPDQERFRQHRRTVHNGAAQGTELIIPVVNLESPTAIGYLSSLGIRHFVPLPQVPDKYGENYGFPLLSIEGGRIPSIHLSALASSRYLSLGQLRQVPQ